MFLSRRVLDESLKLAFEIRDPGRAVEGLVVTEESDQRVGFEIVEPFIGRRVESLAFVNLVLWMELFSPWESPLGLPRWMRAEACGIPRTTEIPYVEFVIWVSGLETSLKIGMIHHPLSQPVSDQDDPFTAFRRLGFGVQRDQRQGERECDKNGFGHDWICRWTQPLRSCCCPSIKFFQIERFRVSEFSVESICET